jgi:hypothetical protein
LRMIKISLLLLLRGQLIIVSTGPGIAIIPAIIFRLFKKLVIHVETWSRFYSKSLTGMIMYPVSDIFIIQNIELQCFYKRAIYAGRL